MSLWSELQLLLTGSCRLDTSPLLLWIQVSRCMWHIHGTSCDRPPWEHFVTTDIVRPMSHMRFCHATLSCDKIAWVSCNSLTVAAVAVNLLLLQSAVIRTTSRPFIPALRPISPTPIQWYTVLRSSEVLKSPATYRNIGYWGQNRTRDGLTVSKSAQRLSLSCSLLLCWKHALNSHNVRTWWHCVLWTTSVWHATCVYCSQLLIIFYSLLRVSYCSVYLCR